MCNEEKDIYLDLNCFPDMEIEEIIAYLKANPDKRISPEYAEFRGFYNISEGIKEAGEEELASKFLELYYNAVIEKCKSSLFDISPEVDAIYAYGMRLLGGKVTPVEALDDKMRHLFVRLCMTGVAMYPDQIDDVLKKYPQFAMMLDCIPEMAYADDGGIYAQLLCNIGWAYQSGTEGIKQDMEKAFSFFAAGAELNYEDRYLLWPRAKAADCAFEAGVCLMKGIGVEKNLEAALEYFEIGARGYGERAVPAMADIYLDSEFEWQKYFEDEEELYIAAFQAYNVRVRHFDGSYMKPSTNYTEEEWDCCFDWYDADERKGFNDGVIKALENEASVGSYRAAKCLSIAYRDGIIVEGDEERSDYYADMAEQLLKENYED